MELQIGQILRNLRRERGEGLPDITILPALARYFGISLDDLFGMNRGPIAEQFREINRACSWVMFLATRNRFRFFENTVISQSLL